jgi:hypothetical protein
MEEISAKKFETLSDWADASQLRPYDDGRRWILINHSSLSLGEVCLNFNLGLKQIIDEWVLDSFVVVYKKFSEVPHCSDGWMVVYFDDAYFLKPYQKQG